MRFVQFAREVLALPMSDAQEAFSRVAFDDAPVSSLPAELAPIARQIFGSGVDVVPKAARALIVLLFGRGSGKSLYCGAYLVWRAFTADLRKLAPGELGYCVSIAPDRELAEIEFNFARNLIANSPLARTIEAETGDSLIVARPDGRRVCIQVFASSAGGVRVRGKSIVAAVIGETAFGGDTTKVVSVEENYRALVARLLPGGKILCPTTPWLRSGFVWELYEANWGKPTTALVAHGPTLLFRGDDPYVRAMVEREFARDEENARRELGAEWLPLGSGNLFDAASLSAAVVDNADRSPHGAISIGGDIGLVQDPSAFVVAQRVTTKRGETDAIRILDVVELKPKRGKPIELEQVVRRAHDLCAEYGVRKVRVDHHSLAQAREWASKLRLSIHFEPCSEGEQRQLRFQRAADLFKRGRIQIPRAFSELTDQLGSLIATPRSDGSYRYEFPRRSGSHCDAAAAFLLAIEPLANSPIAFYEKLAQAHQRGAFGDGGYCPVCRRMPRHMCVCGRPNQLPHWVVRR